MIKIIFYILATLQDLTIRTRAIFYCLYYGILPWWCYENKRHYSCSWMHHLWVNLKIAARWATGQENAHDVQFERMTNKNF